ncbi:MAG: Ger(x)C family spore germination protein [Bacillota bacterium]|nr:Ger(x)C family spore germination protein [Bacillota bacterium]
MKTISIVVKKLNILFLCLILITCFCLTGCQDKYEIEQNAIALALAFDLDKSGNYVMAVQILTSSSSSSAQSQSNTGTGTPSATTYMSTGKNIYDTVYQFSKILGKPIRFTDVKCIVIGSVLASKGIGPVIDFSLRFIELRPYTPILVTTDRIQDVLNIKSNDQPIFAFAVEELIKRQSRIGFTSISTNLDFANDFSGENPITTCGYVTLDKRRTEENYPRIKLTGSAVFKKDKLIGYLNALETRGLQWIKGTINLGSILIEGPDKRFINLGIKNGSSRMNSKKINGKMTIQCTVRVETTVRVMWSDIDPSKNVDIMYALSEKQNEAINNEINLAIDAAKNRLSADIFDFGELIYRQHPKDWKEMKKNWETAFLSTPIDVKISSMVVNTGTISKSLIK